MVWLSFAHCGPSGFHASIRSRCIASRNAALLPSPLVANKYMFGVTVDSEVFYALRHSPLGLPSKNLFTDPDAGAPARPWPPGVCLYQRRPGGSLWSAEEWPPQCWWLRLFTAGHWRLRATRLEYAGDPATTSAFLAAWLADTTPAERSAFFAAPDPMRVATKLLHPRKPSPRGGAGGHWGWLRALRTLAFHVTVVVTAVVHRWSFGGPTRVTRKQPVGWARVADPGLLAPCPGAPGGADTTYSAARSAAAVRHLLCDLQGPTTAFALSCGDLIFHVTITACARHLSLEMKWPQGA